MPRLDIQNAIFLIFFSQIAIVYHLLKLFLTERRRNFPNSNAFIVPSGDEEICILVDVGFSEFFRLSNDFSFPAHHGHRSNSLRMPFQSDPSFVFRMNVDDHDFGSLTDCDSVVIKLTKRGWSMVKFYAS